MGSRPTIYLLKPLDIQPMAAAFARLGWNKPASQYERYLVEQAAGARVVLVAWVNDLFSGYVTILWESSYPFFRQAGIPEIVDLNVLPRFHRQGIGTVLLDEAERQISTRASIAGIGVGMTADYGAAQIMYIKRGYIPDGRGLIRNGQPISYGKQIIMDDSLALYFTKPVKPKTSTNLQEKQR